MGEESCKTQRWSHRCTSRLHRRGWRYFGHLPHCLPSDAVVILCTLAAPTAIWIHNGGGKYSRHYRSVLVLLQTILELMQLLHTCTLEVALGKVLEPWIHIYSNIKTSLLFTIYNPKYLFLFWEIKRACRTAFQLSHYCCSVRLHLKAIPVRTSLAASMLRVRMSKMPDCIHPPHRVAHLTSQGLANSTDKALLAFVWVMLNIHGADLQNETNRPNKLIDRVKWCELITSGSTAYCGSSRCAVEAV